MSEEEGNGSQVGHRDGIDDINIVYNPSHAGEIGAICIPQPDGNAIFEVTSKTLHLLQMRGFYGGLEQEDPHEHVETREVIEIGYGGKQQVQLADR
uniref:Uncharacterized protein n=1 Tax=Solanum tuberosum TaxID=4113 RepID=M1DHN2_SOLTU